MQSTDLPYAGYSWPFTQHAIAINPKNLYGLLAAASLFEGQENPGAKITAEMIKNGLLTANVRDGKADAWRDYQQVLAELGLIYSTKLQKKLKLTQAGKMYVSGEIGFSELITSQALRYQYPNGQKYDLQSRLRGLVGEEYTNLIDLMNDYGVNIKPATLIARVLIELHDNKHEASISIDECLAFLLPVRNNMDWRIAYDQLVKHRESGEPIDKINSHARRNIQDWFKLLGFTDIIDSDDGTLHLSGYGVKALDQIKAFCDEQAKTSNFWKAANSDKEARLGWFKHYGSIPLSDEISRSADDITEDYLKENFVGGVDEDFEDVVKVGSLAVNLTDVRSSKRGGAEPVKSGNFDPKLALENLKKGIVRRRAKTQAHDEIVMSISQHLKEKGAEVFEDPSSVDILAIWPDKTETIFEVKTISRRSVQSRIRMAVGQIMEYEYRRLQQSKGQIDKVIVINTLLPDDSWYLDFLNNHMKIGVLAKNSNEYKESLPESFPTHKFWKF